MGLIDRFKRFRDKRRQSPASDNPWGAASKRTYNLSRPVDVAPQRNREERRFIEHAIRRHAGRLRMRDEGKRAHRQTIKRWQLAMLRDLEGTHWAGKRGRVMR